MRWLDLARAAARHVTVALVAAHLFAITLAALPSPAGGLRRADWAQPTVQAEFEAWSARLGAVGVGLPPDALQDVVFDVATRYHGVHKATLAPFEPYYRYAGTHQTWRMFIAPHRFPTRLQIRIHERGEWRVVYEERSPRARWMARELDHDRVRSAIFRYGWGNKYARSWLGFGDWIAGRAARDFPGADRLELRFAAYKTPTPAEARAGVAPAIRWHRRREIALGSLR
jgi:hypothetical protein